jgi:hypothetical protein
MQNAEWFLKKLGVLALVLGVVVVVVLLSLACVVSPARRANSVRYYPSGTL